MKHPEVKDSVAFGIPDRIKGESIAAILVLEKSAKSDRDKFMEYCRKNLPNYKVPKKILFRSDILKNPAGKPLRRLIRQEIE